MKDTLNISYSDTINYIRILIDKDENNWQLYFLILGIISIIVAIIIPFLQKKYEHNKSKNSFNQYLKYYLGKVISILISDKIKYGSLENSNRPHLLEILFKEACDKFYKELIDNKDTSSPTIKYQLIFNLQSIFIKIYHFSYALKTIDFDSIKEKILAYGDKLSRKELNNIYSLLATIENLSSITYFNDIFGNLKSVERILNKDNIWVGLKTENNFFSNQEDILNKEFKYILENKEKIRDIVLMTNLTVVQIEVFYGTFKGKLVKISKSKNFQSYYK